MKFTLSSLKEYLITKASLQEICAKLTAIGLEVESVEDKAKTLSAFSVAKILIQIIWWVVWLVPLIPTAILRSISSG